MIRRVILSRQAQKDIDSVPQHVAMKLLAWVTDVERRGLEDVRKRPGFHDEPLKGRRAGERSIRLSLSYRAIYTVEEQAKESVAVVQEVTKHRY